MQSVVYVVRYFSERFTARSDESDRFVQEAGMQET